MSRMLRRLSPYRVAIREHDVPPRWRIPSRVTECYALTADDARLATVRDAHRAAGVPPWKPCVRVSLRHTTIESSA